MMTGAFANAHALGFRHPFSQLNLLKRQMDAQSDAMFHRLPVSQIVSSIGFPAINLTEDDNFFYVRAELPGMKSEDIDVQVAGSRLMLSGKRKMITEGEHVRYHRREREAGHFSRAINLPGGIDSENVAAKLTNGLLKITIPKAESAKPRTIAVN